MCRSPLQLFRKGLLSVSDLVKPLWCEAALEFELSRGRRMSAVMRKGSKRHKELEKEVHEIQQVEVKCPEELWALRFLTAQMGLLELDSGITRELPVFGQLESGLYVFGIVDQLDLCRVAGDAWVILKENKTRSTRSVPSLVQSGMTRLQLMIYKRLYDSLATGSVFDQRGFLECLNLNQEQALSSEFLSSFKDKYGLLSPDMTLRDILEQTLLRFRTCRSAASELTVIYELQKDHSRIGTDTFIYDNDWVSKLTTSAIEFWKGRVPTGVESDEFWKCRVCEFAADCKHRMLAPTEGMNRGVKS